MLKVAVTGNIGSGKSIITHLFQLLDIPVFLADQSGHKALCNVKIRNALIDIFGDQIFDLYGHPDRKKIASVVFLDHEKLQKLNQLVHPLVKEDMLHWFEQHQAISSYIVCESAILFEANFETFFDKIITVAAPETIRLNRTTKRDNISIELIQQRMSAQIDEKIKISKSDFCIFNDNNQSVINQVVEIHESLLKSSLKNSK